MDELRILIADESPVYRKMIIRAVTEVDQNASVTYVANGGEALEFVKRNDYNVIIVDAEVPGMGLPELLKGIKLETTKASILVTARPSPANESLCLEALNRGAAAFMIKPINDSYSENLKAIKSEIADIIRALSNDRKQMKGMVEPAPETVKKTIERSSFHPGMVLVAASTGGPAALETVISKLKGGFPVPILIVQHMPPLFTGSFAQHLDSKSKLKVKVAESGEAVSAGTVYIAPGGMHMKLDRKSRILLDDSPPVNGVRPAADALFESVAEGLSVTEVLAVVLTGMGLDGKKGLALLKEKKKCYCLAQSEKTCVVYGMPRAVIEEGLADKILDLDKIAREMEKLCN